MCICKRAPSFLFSNITDSSVRPIFWPWLLSAAQNRCGDLLVTELALCSVHGARPEISGCAGAEHQPPGPLLKQRQQATAYLERIHMELPTSNCLQSTFHYVNFVNDFMRTPLIQRGQSDPLPQNLRQGSLFPSYSSLWFKCSCLTPINNSLLLRFLAPYLSLGQGLMIIIGLIKCVMSQTNQVHFKFKAYPTLFLGFIARDWDERLKWAFATQRINSDHELFL